MACCKQYGRLPEGRLRSWRPPAGGLTKATPAPDDRDGGSRTKRWVGTDVRTVLGRTEGCVVRGELDDALARLARREELQRRRAGAAAAPDDVLDEIADALRRVVALHPGLSVTAAVTDARGSSTVRVGWLDGSAAVVPPVEAGEDRPEYSPAGTDRWTSGDVVDEPVAGRTPYTWPMTVRTVPASPGGDPPIH